jgi:hypothetical protein
MLIILATREARDQDDHGSRPAIAKSSGDHISTNKGWVCWDAPVIPVLWAAYIGGSQPSPGIKQRSSK